MQTCFNFILSQMYSRGDKIDCKSLKCLSSRSVPRTPSLPRCTCSILMAQRDDTHSILHSVLFLMGVMDWNIAHSTFNAIGSQGYFQVKQLSCRILYCAYAIRVGRCWRRALWVADDLSVQCHVLMFSFHRFSGFLADNHVIHFTCLRTRWRMRVEIITWQFAWI